MHEAKFCKTFIIAIILDLKWLMVTGEISKLLYRRSSMSREERKMGPPHNHITCHIAVYFIHTTTSAPSVHVAKAVANLCNRGLTQKHHDPVKKRCLFFIQYFYMFPFLCCFLNFWIFTSLAIPSPRLHIDMYTKKKI
jgi:hypothetical protein